MLKSYTISIFSSCLVSIFRLFILSVCLKKCVAVFFMLQIIDNVIKFDIGSDVIIALMILEIVEV